MFLGMKFRRDRDLAEEALVGYATLASSVRLAESAVALLSEVGPTGDSDFCTAVRCLLLPLAVELFARRRHL